MKEFKHTYSMNPDWRQKFISELGCTIEGDTMYPPEELAEGSCCFSQVMPDLSILVTDVILNKHIEFTRVPYNDEFWIIYYDLSDNFSRHVINHVDHKIGYRSKLNFAIIDNQIRSTYASNVGERSYSLRMFVRKSFIKKIIGEASYNKELLKTFNGRKKSVFFYGHIDSKSKTMLYNLKKQSFDDPYFDFSLKAAACNLLSILIERLNNEMPSTSSMLEKDIQAVMKSQSLLLSDLTEPFPGTKHLADLANMSCTKYITLYKKIFGKTPAVFFKNEKLLLAKELLESQNFKSISDISYELGYVKASYFSSIYRDYFQQLPNTVFKKQLNTR